MTDGAAYQSRFERTALGALALSTALLYGAALVFPTPRLLSPVPMSSHRSDRAALPLLSSSAVILPVSRLTPERLRAETLQNIFDQVDYSLESVAGGASQVPQLHLSAIPGDLRQIHDAGARKDLFLRLMLPLVLQVNDELTSERRRLAALHRQRGRGAPLSSDDDAWLSERFSYYRVSFADGIGYLLHIIDIIPPSLALAQAAMESGWGTSRLARLRNVLFGQTTVGDDPQAIAIRGPGKRVVHYKTFATPADAVRSYARNLNSHPAYESFRRARAQMRTQGASLAGRGLVENLENYAEMAEYSRSLQRVIRSNDLGDLDEATLAVNEDVLRF
ncbi:MAG: hypothetical protein FD153_1066 [Rhodospirillaceae bacterium]|nr:MAG: hypothetical protein FD153_1066 [Rhodospirillaceae bacterium]